MLPSTKGRLKNCFAHKVSQKLRTTSTAEYFAMGVGFTVTAGVLIASTSTSHPASLLRAHAPARLARSPGSVSGTG